MSERIELKKSKWQLSRHEFYAAKHYALQYHQWEVEYNNLAGMDAIVADGMPHGNKTGNPTESKGIRMAELSEKMERIKRLCKEANERIAFPWLFMSVTCEYMNYTYLATRQGMPCGERQYKEYRRKFYYLLCKEL